MDLLQLKSDYQFAEMCHKAQGTDLTKLNLKKAKEAYENALSEAEELEDPSDEGQAYENQHERLPAIKSIAELVQSLTADEFKQLQAALDEQLRSTSAAQYVPLSTESGIVTRITVPASLFERQPADTNGNLLARLSGQTDAETSEPAPSVNAYEKADTVQAPAPAAKAEAIKPTEVSPVPAATDEKTVKTEEKKSTKKAAK